MDLRDFQAIVLQECPGCKETYKIKPHLARCSEGCDSLSDGVPASLTALLIPDEMKIPSLIVIKAPILFLIIKP